MKKRQIAQFLSASSLALICSHSMANTGPYTVTGSITKSIPTHARMNIQGVNASTRPSYVPVKKIKLMKIKLSSGMKTTILRQMQTASGLALAQPRPARHDNMPSKKELGMGNVPVLDQGWHGSCVTFANVAALDAALGKGNLISPLCSLALGKTLGQYGFYPSGWDGSRGPFILDQFMRFGYVEMASQQERTCGGMSQYPTNDENTGEPMELRDYYEMSRSIRVNWEPIAATIQADDETPIDFKLVVKQIKKALLDEHRVTFAILIDVNVPSTYPGATGTTLTKNDTWVLSDTIKQDALTDLDSFGGHEMIITGYNDDAVVIDENGKKHYGAFTLRNSWGADTGNAGTFFMSYDYAQFLLMEAQKIEA